MNTINCLRSILILFIVFFANTAMGQKTFTWNGANSSNWATAANWTVAGSGGTSTYPGQSTATATDLVVINKNDTPNAPVISVSPPNAVTRVTINNAFGTIAGATLTINPGATLTITSATSTALVLNGGNMVNNGTLTINNSAVGTSTFEAKGITCGNPTVPPTITTPATYSYSGTGALNVNLTNASAFANSSAIAVTALNAFATYNFLFNGTTTFNLSSTNATFGIRVGGGTAAASPLIIGGAGFTLNNNGGLIAAAASSTVTVNSGTTLTLNSATGNLSNGLSLINGNTSLPTNFTNNGIINILGETARNGINVNINTADASNDVRINILNTGTINVDITAITVATGTTLGYSAYNATAGSATSSTVAEAGVVFTNNGILSLKNSSSGTGLGYAIWGSSAGQRTRTNFTNNGTLNIEGTTNNVGQGFTLTNNATVNSNSTLAGFTALNNNSAGSINFSNSPAVFTVLTAATATTGAVYRDANLNVYTVNTTKIATVGTQLLASIDPIRTIPATGTLSRFSGTGDATIAYTAIATLANAITSPTTNAGTINTGKGAGASLSSISGTTTTTATSVIAPGGTTEKGIVTFSAATQTILGKLNLQVSGSATAGVDFDQITNSASNGGFDITGSTLEITSLYTPTNSVTIPLIVASGSGTISGSFASVTGLTSGWTLSYASPISVNLVYTFVVIPTIWTGVANNDFFNEANWRDSVTNAVPNANTINPGTDINLHLQINSAATTITSGVIQFGTGSLAISSANLNANSLSGGTVTVNEGGYIELSGTTPLLNNVQINFTSGIGWIKTPNYNPSNVSAGNLGQIKVNNITAVYANNLRLDNYYLNGCVIRANLAATTPLTVYDSANLVGTPVGITVNTLHSGAAIANLMNNKIESFILKKGFMLTVAIENDGTGKSKNYIASEADLVINILPQTLQNSISFIRVMPWNWVTKKGFNAPVDSNLDASWRYQWNPNESSTLNWEFAPMAWGHTSANDPSDITSFIGRYNTPYVMSFNEADDCTGQSGQYGNLCQTDVAVGYHKNLMKTGMRIVSPGCKEEGAFGWLKEFYDKTTAQDIRVDVIAVHWYDWGSNPAVNTNPTALQVFNRFKAYLTNVHNLYGLPIWITEFNANPARSQAINAGFLELALPYLESLDYIERYCWFPYNTGTHFTTGWDSINRVPTNTIPSLVGTIYKNINNTTPVNSSPAIPEATVDADNSLDLSSYPNIALNKPATVSSNLTNLGADKAVDGDKTTSTSRWVVELATLPAWIEVDLQGSFLVDSFRITEDVNTVKNFRFEVWDASLNSGVGGWATALTVANNPATPLTTFRTISPVNTTKVRLFVTGHNAADRMRIFELEVFGTPSSPIWTGNTSTNWATASNWSTNTVPSQFSNVLINGGTPFQPTISATTTINSLSIAAGGALTVTAPNLTIEGTIDNAGTMSLSNNSNLLQGEEFFPNSGNISINRNSSALRRLDYSIWSSPVENQNLSAFSPETSLNRFYDYNQTSNLYNAVVSPTTTAFGLAAGHLIRMPNTHPATATAWNGTFTGVPNNGTITRVVTYRNEAPLNFGYNMIGNPYPSTLDASAFITENASKIENILYFWRKTNGAGGSAYATWINGIGGTASGAGSAVPNGTIQVGQGFFVRAKPGTNLALLTFNQTLTFNNSMRLGNTSTQFFKTKQATEPDRVWLNLTNDKGVFSQALIGYVNVATQGVDDFDGKYINDSTIALTSNINNEEYTIQGRPKFDTSDIVALNFKTDFDGEYTIALDHFDGVFANGQDIYLVDSKAGIETDLKVRAYNFTATAGNDNSRFSLKYQKTLKVDAPTFNENNVRIYKNKGTIFINSQIVAINNIKVYDIQGRLIAEQNNIKAMTATLKDLKVSHQVLIVKVTGEDNSVVAKKVVN